MIDNLSKEITKRILADIGVSPGKLFGKVGLTDPAFKLAGTVTVRYDDSDRRHDLYSGKLELGEFILRGLLIDLTIDKDSEFLFVFRMDEMPIHAIKVVFDNTGDCFFKIFDSDKSVWREASMYLKARILADFERIVGWGILWKDCLENEDLYKAAVELVR